SGTSPRLLNSSSRRSITPGSARAWTENDTVAGKSSPSASDVAAKEKADDIVKFLGGVETNQPLPSPDRAPVANSPSAGAMRRLGHHANVCLTRVEVKPGWRVAPMRPLGSIIEKAQREETGMAVVLGTDGFRYEVTEGWAKLPPGMEFNADVAAV